MDITGINKAKLLQALYNGSKQQGMGFLNQRGALPMSLTEAEQLLEKHDYFDYLHGRVMKVGITSDSNHLDTWGYDRDNGDGACNAIVERLRAEG